MKALQQEWESHRGPLLETKNQLLSEKKTKQVCRLLLI